MINVLVIDDDKIDQQAVMRLLTNNGMKVTGASSGKEALEIKQDFQCIIIDYLLPDYDGVELAKKFLQVTNTAIILITGQGDELLAVKALKSGVYDYIPKGDLSLLPQAIIASTKKNELQQSDLKKLVELNDNLSKKLNGGI